MSISKNKKRILSRDFRRNAHFKDLIDRYQKAEKTNEKSELLLEVADKLGIGLDEFQKMEALGEEFEIIRMADGEDMSDTEIDMCKIQDRILENKLDKMFPMDVSIALNLEKEMSIVAYPVSININKFASRRNVEAFIASHWKRISEIQARNIEKKITITGSKNNDDRDNFIYKYWEQEMCKGRKLKAIVGDLHGPDRKVMYPGKIVDYNEIRGVIRQEKKRRNKKIV